MRQFSPPHLAALAVLLTVACVSVWAARHHPGRWQRIFSGALAALIFAAWVGEYVADVILGTWSVQYTLPLQLTDAISAVAIAALLTQRRLLIELAYFWAFTASLQATLTPDLAQSFPSVFYFTYFTYHVGAIVAASFLVFGCRLYPRRGAVWRVYAITLAWAGVAGIGDVLTGGNYMYLRAKPVHSSLLSVLGPWPWYIVSTAAVGLAMLIVLGAITNRIRVAVDPAGGAVSYRWIEHTAELELEIEAQSAEAAFADGLLALAELLTDEQPGQHGAAVSVQLSVAGRDRATLFAAWLDELAFRAETDGLVPTAIEQIELGEHALTATVRCVLGSPRHLIKGVTHHRLTFEPADGAFRATVVLDV